MMLWSLQASHVLLDALPELILGALHELVGDLLLVSLPIVLRHLNLIMILGV